MGTPARKNPDRCLLEGPKVMLLGLKLAALELVVRASDANLVPQRQEPQGVCCQVKDPVGVILASELAVVIGESISECRAFGNRQESVGYCLIVLVKLPLSGKANNRPAQFCKSTTL